MRSIIALLLATLFVSAPAGAQSVYTINVILPMTGAAAFIGQLQRDTLRAFETMANRTGGLRKVPIHFNILDDQSSPQVALQLADQVKAGKAPVVIGPSIVAECAAAAPLMSDGPVEYCLSPGFYPKAASYSYAAAPSLDGTTPAVVRYLRLHGMNRIAVLAATDASGQTGYESTRAAFQLPENAALKNVAYENFNPADISAAAQVGRIKATDPQALIVYATGAAFLNVLRALHDAGVDIPLYTSLGNLVPSVLEANRNILPSTLIFNGYAYEDGKFLGKGPLLNAANEFEAAHKALGLQSNPVGALAWDPAKLVLAALRSLGPNASAAQIRDWLENQTKFPGVMGFYDFKHIHDQHGLGGDDVVIIQWDPKKNEAVPVNKIGGSAL